MYITDVRRMGIAINHFRQNCVEISLGFGAPAYIPYLHVIVVSVIYAPELLDLFHPGGSYVMSTVCVVPLKLLADAT